jgi:hypothetical protein
MTPYEITSKYIYVELIHIDDKTKADECFRLWSIVHQPVYTLEPHPKFKHFNPEYGGKNLPPKLLYPPTSLHCIKTQNAAIPVMRN